MKLCKKLCLCLMVVMALLLCTLALPQTAHAANEVDLWFELNENRDGYIVTSCSESTAGELVIPATYNGLPVTAVGNAAFLGRPELTSVTIPDSVITIGGSAFEDCYSLTSVTIGNGVTIIDNRAFYGCASLTSVSIGNSVNVIGNSAFYGCWNLTDITIPDSVTGIDNSAFYGCSSLTNVVIPSSVIEIGDYAFNSCNSLTSITIPDSVIWMGDSAFTGHSIKKLIIAEGSTTVTSAMVVSKSTLEEIIIPNSVVHVDSGAFNNCYNLVYNTYSNGKYLGSEANPYLVLVGVTTKALRSYTIHPDTRFICDYAFQDCSKMESISIPNGVTTIGYSAFRYCSGLISITIPNSVTYLMSSIFEGCSNLASVTISDKATTIGYGVFQGCSNLTSITIPDSVTQIGRYAFQNCYKLATITIGDGVTSIDDSAFRGCRSLTSITIGDSVTTIGSGAFSSCSGLTSITIPDSVTTIGSGAFSSCSGLTSITIPDSVTTIGGSAFSSCSKLSSVTVGSGVTSIETCAFSDCPALTTVALRDSVIYIADEAFYGCDALETVIYCGTNGKWAAMDRTTGNDPLDNATLQLHNYASGVCTFCGKLESGATAVTLSAPEGVVYRGDTVTITVSTDKVEHCAAGGFLFDFDTDIFEYVSGEALVSGFSAAGISTNNGKIAGYFMNGDETLEGAIFQITLRVKEDVDFTDYTISGIPSLSIKQDGLLEQIPCEAFDTTVSVACRHSFGDWIEIDETWHKHICAICSFEETLYIEYSITFQYADGTVISAATYHYGDTVIVPQPEPQNPNSYFTGWDKEIAVCTGDAVYTAIFVDYIPGDMDGDGEMTYNDAIYLLLNQMFGDENYPLSTAPADIDGNGTVNLEDAIYLLLRNLFGEEFYPLKKD